ncbi:MAG: extracellular solute-binding protein [Rhodospirillales bacterium]|nr:extracellular solute-binding protein [Rhodospirillales bacterium]
MRTTSVIWFAAYLAAMAAATASAWAADYVEFWHTMSGQRGTELRQMVTRFNAVQPECSVVPIYAGNFFSATNSVLDVLDQNNPPKIIQIDRTATATLLASRDRFYPIRELMSAASEPFNQSQFLLAVAGSVTDENGDLMALPFDLAAPVLYYNKDAFRLAGLDPKTPPRTWPDVARAAHRTQAAGYACGLTTGRPSWVHIENFAAWHNLPFATYANGLDPGPARLAFNARPFIRHLETLGEWQSVGVFEYSGPNEDGPNGRNEAAQKFLTQHCVMYTDSSSEYAALKTSIRGFEFEIGPLPYWPDDPGAPQNTLIGGSYLWSPRGGTQAEDRCVARFFGYLISAPVQAAWHQATGDVPTTSEAYAFTRAQGYYAVNPGTNIAVQTLELHPPTVHSRGIRLGDFAHVQQIIEEQLRSFFAGTISAQTALDVSVDQGNRLIAAFEAKQAAQALTSQHRLPTAILSRTGLLGVLAAAAGVCIAGVCAFILVLERRRGGRGRRSPNV